jgi:hypothetical protein
MNNNLIDNKIKELINKFPIERKNVKNAKQFIPTTLSLGDAKKFPDQESFTKIRMEYLKHSEACLALNHTELYDFFKKFEDCKGSFIYIFWANYPTTELKTGSFDFITNNSFEKAPKFNKRNIYEHIKEDSLLVPIYVGKSEGKLNGRIICHVDGTKGQYPALKIRERFNGAHIYLSLIKIGFNGDQKEDEHFLKKVMCFSLEYFMATRLKPVIGMHK